MASPAVTARQILVDKGITGTIEVSRMPDSPNECITIYDSGGQANNPKWLLDYPTIQVMVRGNPDGYAAAYQKAKDVQDALLGLESQTIGGNRWVSVLAMGGIISLGYDEKNRPSLSMNFRITIEPAASTYTNREPL